MRALLIVVTGLLSGASIAAGVFAERSPERQPFRLLVRQTEPPVELFRHEPTGTCFVGYQPGGLVVVDKDLCKGPWPIVPPIVLPPISPER